MAEMIEIDGAMGEGGGQVIRTSVTLSAITGKPCTIVNVRAGRPKPGLAAQHLTSVNAAAALCGATVRGGHLGSLYLSFEPQHGIKSGDYVFDVAEARNGASAGAASLVLQTIIPALLHGEGTSTVLVKGGTHVPMSPGMDFLQRVFLPALKEMGPNANLELSKAGFFPKGGGEARLTLSGWLEKPMLRIERGKLKKLHAVVTSAGLPEHVGERGLTALKAELKDYGVHFVGTVQPLPSPGAGAAVLLTAECEKATEGWQSLGERGKPIERVASDCAKAFKKWYASNTGTDEHTADQLALLAALTPGVSEWTTREVTEHLRTVLNVIRQFLDVETHLEELPDGSGRVKVQGTRGWPR